MSGGVDQIGLFARLRWRLFANAYRVFREGSIVRPATVLASSAIVWAFVFIVSWLGFHAIRNEAKVPIDGGIVVVLIGLLFFTLGGALVFSTGLILHGSLFNSAEAAFLLARPVTADHVFAYKFQGAMGFSSWAFILLGCPVLIAYGLACQAPWWFHASLPLFFLGFILLPGALGALLALLMANYLPNRRRTLWVLAGFALAAGVVWWVWGTVAESRAIAASGEAANEAFGALMNRMSFSAWLGLPSAWVARGLNAAARGDLAGTGWYLLLLWSNGLFAYIAVTWLASRIYRRGYNRLATGGDLRRRHGNAFLDRVLMWLLPFARPTLRQLVLKDFRTFRRDPQQWGQVVLFLTLLALYFSNIRRMFIHGIEWPFQNGLSMLNVAAISLLLCTYTGRFIYPMLSLEGRKFWILGLLPIGRDELVWGKFGFSAVGGLILSLPMVLFSDVMLGMPWHTMCVHAVTAVVLAAGLSGLSVGLGACMPNFKETDPSKIAVGFGGTVNLVVGLVFLLGLLAVMCGPYHAFMAAARPTPGTPQDAPGPISQLAWPVVGASLLLGIAAGAVAALIPLRMGVEALRRMEF
jgi:ABC-2 type transport system permease protein